MNRRGCCLSVNALCCFRHNSSSHVFFRVDLMLHNPPNIFSLPLITQWHFLCLLLPLLPPTACICTLTIHNLAKCICVPFFFFSFTFVCMLLKCHYDWGAHARKCHKIGHLQMRKKTDLFLGVFLSVSECNFENTQMTWVFAMVQSTAFFIYDLRKLRMQNFLLTITESCRKRCRVITHGCLCICCRSTMQQPE